VGRRITVFLGTAPDFFYKEVLLRKVVNGKGVTVTGPFTGLSDDGISMGCSRRVEKEEGLQAFEK